MKSTQLIFALLAVLSGACLPLQASVNGAFRKNLGNPLWATFFSICGTILFAGTVMLALRPTPPAMDAVRTTQWWNWVGGPLGTLIVLAGVYLARPLGAATFIALVVAGQLVTATAFDHFALFGLEEKPLSLGRVVGVVLVIAGVVAVKYL